MNIEESNRYKLRVPVNKYSNSRILNDFPDNLHTSSRIEVYGTYGGCRWPLSDCAWAQCGMTLRSPHSEPLKTFARAGLPSKLDPVLNRLW